MKVESVLPKLRADILAATPVVRDFILFGSATCSDHPRDIDIALVVPDEVNLFDVVRRVSPILASHSVRLGMLVSCFPIHADRFDDASSQFISNVREHGRRF